MRVFEARTAIDATPEQLFEWHARPGAFERLTPPWRRVRVVERIGGVEVGARLAMRVGVGPFNVAWVARIERCEPGRGFSDVQERGPFKSWRHEHRFVPAGSGASLEDRVEYELPGGVLGGVARGYIARDLERMFRRRHAVTRLDMARRQQSAGQGPLRVAITGASGLVGASLAAFLSAGGHQVVKLVRRPARGDAGEAHWDPETGVIDAGALEGLDGVVHLAGANIGAGRWTLERRALIRDSRVRSTRLIAETIARLGRPPRVFVSASAIGYYGDRGDELLTEDSDPGAGFLADVCREWEAAAAPAAAATRVALLRTGVVLAARGGALARLLPAFSLGLGGRVGDGRQFMSWIGLEDVIGAIHFCLATGALSGPINIVAPEAVDNAGFTAALARALRRPAIFPLPAPVVRAALGEMGESLLLHGARVVPRRLLDAGFRFESPRLDQALALELGLPAPA